MSPRNTPDDPPQHTRLLVTLNRLAEQGIELVPQARRALQSIDQAGQAAAKACDDVSRIAERLEARIEAIERFLSDRQSCSGAGSFSSSSVWPLTPDP